MSNRVKKEIEAIGKKVIEGFEGFDEYEADPDECYTDYSLSHSFNYKGVDVECSIRWRDTSLQYIEILLYPAEGHSMERLEQAVNDYVEENLDEQSLVSNIMDKEREDNMDEWQWHGFRDAADYYHYRYG